MRNIGSMPFTVTTVQAHKSLSSILSIILYGLPQRRPLAVGKRRQGYSTLRIKEKFLLSWEVNFFSRSPIILSEQ